MRQMSRLIEIPFYIIPLNCLFHALKDHFIVLNASSIQNVHFCVHRQLELMLAKMID